MPFEAHKLGTGPSKNIHFSKCFIVWAKTPENKNMMIFIDIVPYKILWSKRKNLPQFLAPPEHKQT